MARVSNSSSPTNSSISVLVQLDVGSDGAQYYTTISCYEYNTGAFIGTSYNLGGLPHYNSGAKHWTYPYTFSGLKSGTTYQFTASSTWGYIESNIYTTTGSPPSQTPPTPSAYQNNAVGSTMNLIVNNTGNATQLKFKPDWTGSWEYRYLSWDNVYPFEAPYPHYGYTGNISVRGWNQYGDSGDKIVGVKSQPRVPTIKDEWVRDNTVRIKVTTSGYFDRIEVEMYPDGSSTYYTKKTLWWTGNINHEAYLEFGGMAQGARYSFRAIAYQDSGYNSGYGGRLYIDNINPPPAPKAKQYSARGRDVSIIIEDYYTATSLKYKPSWTGVWSTDTTLASIRSYTVDDFGTEYSVAIRGNNSAGDSPDKLVYVTSEPRVPTIASAVTQNNKASVTVTTSGGFTRIDIDLLDQNAEGVIETKSATYSGQTVTFNSTLVPNATYLLRAKAFKTASYGGFSPESAWGGYFPFKNNVARPVNWSWHTTKASGQPFNITANEWNEFFQKINAFRQYKNLSEYNFTRASRGGIFYFYIFNEAKSAIDDLAPTGLSNVTTKSKVYASYFNTLSSKLNSIS